MEMPIENLSQTQFSFSFFSRYTFWPICNVLLDGVFNLLCSIPFVLIKSCNRIFLMGIPLESSFTGSCRLSVTRKWDASAFYLGIYVFIQCLWSCINTVWLGPAALSEWWWYITLPNDLQFIEDFSCKQRGRRIVYWVNMIRGVLCWVFHPTVTTTYKIIVIYIFQLGKLRFREVQQPVQTTQLINGKCWART